MAQTLKLYQAPYASGQSAQEINLLDPSGWHLMCPGWVPAVGDPNPGGNARPVEEALRIASNFSDQDALADALIALNKLRNNAVRFVYGDRQQQVPVWFYDQLNNETETRRATVRKISLEPLAEEHGVSADDAGSMIDAKPNYEFGIERSAYWERTAAVEMPEANPAAAAAVTYDYTASGGADVTGDSPARISFLSISSGKTYNDPIGRLWIGIRSTEKHGTMLAYFQTIWELEDAGATLGTDAARADDNTASPGDNGASDNKVTVTPGTATWAKRLTITLGSVLSSINYVVDNYGMYLWLLRAQVSSGTWEVQLRFGYEDMDDDDFVQGRIQELTSTSWDYLEMGNSEIPLRNLQSLPSSGMHELGDSYYTIQIWARRTSGSGTLDLDCLCPIPIDEGYLIASGFSMQGDGSHRRDWIFSESPNGHTQYLIFDDDTARTEHIGEPDSIYNFRLPPGDGRMIIVYARESSSDITDRLDAINVDDDGDYFPRWLVLRGSE